MAAPVVQSLEEIMAGLDPAYSGQKDIYNQQLSAVPGKYTAQKEALGVKKENTFRDIQRGANAKGLAFSGMPIEEQTRYLGESYLPALAGYDTQANQEQSQLQLMLAQLSADQRLKATDMRTGQQTQLADYEENERQRAFQAEQARLEREAQERAAAADRAFQAAQAQASRSASAAQNKSASNQEVFASKLSAAAGRDGKVSPGTYNALKNQWVASGYGSFKDFHDRFWKFANESHWWDYR